MALAILFRQRDPSNWQQSDWAGTLISITTGLIFFALAYVAGRRAERRNRAAANATLATTVGRLAASSSRISAGEDDQALRVASGARAALQYYDTADQPLQQELVGRVTAANTDLVFGTFCRADGLSRVVWSTLNQGQTNLIKEIEKLRAPTWGRGRPDEEQDGELEDLSDHVRFAQEIGSAVVLAAKHPPVPGKPAKLLVPPATPEEKLNILRRFRRLYRDELVVVQQWELLYENSGALQCSVMLYDLADTRGWCAPWYVKRKEGSVVPVNVEGESLNEAAQYDTVVATEAVPVPLYPEPLRHGAIPDGVRVERIRAMQNIVTRSHPITVCVLVYDMILGDERRRIVLDGNHRLAAAHDLTSQMGPSPRILAFVICEREQLTVRKGETVVTSSDPHRKGWEWQGFTPDIGLLRGFRPSEKGRLP